MDNRRTRRRRVRRFIAYSLVILIALLTAAAIWCVYQWQHDPQYWTDNQAFLQSQPSQQIDQIAMAAENQIFNLLSLTPQTRGPSQKPIEKHLNLNTQQINAWLARRLPAWSSNRNFKLPPEIKHVMIHTEDGRLAVAFAYEKNGTRKIVTLVFNITLIGEGKAMVHLTQLRGGSLPIKPSWLINNIQDSNLKQLAAQMIKGKIMALKFPHPANAKRTMVIKNLSIYNNGIIVDVLIQ